MERTEKKELRSIDYKSSFSEEQEVQEAGLETNIDKNDNKQQPVKWELVILKQIIICSLIIILLGVLGNIPRIGPGIINRFRYVLKYGEEERPQYKIYSFAGKQWNEVKEQVSSWFTVEIKEALAPPGKSIQFLLRSIILRKGSFSLIGFGFFFLQIHMSMLLHRGQ